MPSPITFARHPAARLGVALTTGSALLFLILLVLDLAGRIPNPYAGLFIFLALPVVFVIGLILIPIGAWRERRSGVRAPEWPRIDLNNPAQRGVLWFITFATFANFAILSVATVGGVEHMETEAFCGQVCHEVMEPQFTAHQAGPHANVSCVACHIGPGVRSFVQAKTRGVSQLIGVFTGNFDRPIRPPIGAQRPSREICTGCHWPERFLGDRLRVVHEFGDDEENSDYSTALRLHVGGADPVFGAPRGIHWHADQAIQIDYVATDESGATIPYVKLTDRDGTVTEYVAAGSDTLTMAGTRVTMDCLGCHNRPAHAFAVSAEREVDQALGTGLISPALPYVRREAVAALAADYADPADAREGIAARLNSFYDREYPGLGPGDARAIDEAIGVVQALRVRNVFSRMNVRFGTYERQMGHTSSAGCFRCHDDSHVADNGAVISQDCEICHGFE